jgi:hypothetical protein
MSIDARRAIPREFDGVEASNKCPNAVPFWALETPSASACLTVCHFMSNMSMMIVLLDMRT